MTDAIAVRTALNHMSRAHREILALHYIADLPVDDIAALLRIPAGTVKSRLSRARDALLREGNLTHDKP